MREIKFRGFSKKHQQWLTGNYILNRGAHFIAPVDEPADGKTWEDYEVDPDTVGQYTGLTDKNGREIYEGDIAEWDGGQQIFKVKVVWDESVARDVLINIDDDEFLASLDSFDARLTAVIGNIHDNPELLKRNEQ